MAQSCRYHYTVFYLLSAPKQMYKLKLNLLTLEVHFLITFTNSDITKCTHFTAGALSLSICRLTIASNAMSGVNRPTLHSHTNRKRIKQSPNYRQVSKRNSNKSKGWSSNNENSSFTKAKKKKETGFQNFQISDSSFLFSLVSIISVWRNLFITIFGDYLGNTEILSYIESRIWPRLFKSRIADKY